jgi:predicted metalloendopeptidase
MMDIEILFVIAARVSEALDEAVDPCENFYDFACGTWRKKTVISEDRSNIDSFGILRDEVGMTLKCKFCRCMSQIFMLNLQNFAYIYDLPPDL